MAVNFIVGDCLTALKRIPDNTFDCIITSPPYFALRNYGNVSGQIGAESTAAEYLSKMVTVCRELRRVLKPTGTFWLNIGDTYSRITETNSSIKANDLCLIPNHLVLLLRDDGWHVRSEIIWHKPTPMPEGVRNRPTCAHEKVWLLTKSTKYFYNFDAVSERCTSAPHTTPISPAKLRAKAALRNGAFVKQYADPNRIWGSERRNLRNVWTLAPTPVKNSHVAMMPTTLAERCIKAGCPIGGRVLDPFGGAGTTGLMADRLGCHCTLLELNPEYVEIAKHRISEDRVNRKLRKAPSRPVYNKPTRSLLGTFKPKRKPST